MQQLKWKKTEAFLFVVPVLLVALPSLSHVLWLYDPRLDALDREARRLSGRNAIDYGEMGSRNFQAAFSCQVKALRGDHAFRMRYDLNQGNHVESTAIVKTPAGDTYWLDYDYHRIGIFHIARSGVRKRLLSRANK